MKIKCQKKTRKSRIMKRIKKTTKIINKKCIEKATLRLKLAIEVSFST